ncbi:MFS transporter [Streptomyces sp. NPDC001348]
MTYGEPDSTGGATAPADSAPKPGKKRSRGFFGELGANYRRLWSATIVSDLGDGLRLSALPLLAASLTDSPMAVAGVTVAAGLPWLLLSLLGGALVDRVDRKTVMVRVQLVRAVVVGAFTAWAALGRPPIGALYVLVFTLTTCEVLFSAAAPAMLPRLVAKEKLPLANARMFGGTITAKEMAGPPLGGFLVAAALAAPFAADAVSFAVGALLLMRLTGDFAPEQQTGPRTSVWSSAAHGLRWVAGNTFVRTIIVGFGVANLTRAMTTSIFVLFCSRVLHVNGWGYGVLWSTAAVGALLGSLLTARLRTLLDDSGLVVGAMVLHGVSTTVIGIADSAYLVGVASAGFGFATMVWNVIGISAQQKVIPDALMGRVMSVDQLVTWGTIPVGALVGGVVADAWGLRAPIVGGGLVMIATALLIGRTVYRSLADLAGQDAPAGAA